MQQEDQKTYHLRVHQAASQGMGSRARIFMVRKAQNYQLKHSLSLFFLNIMEFSNSFRLGFCFVFLQTLYNIKYLFFTYSGGSVWKTIHGTGRSIRTIRISFVRSLHDCKIVNTDYLLTLFYLESRFHMESVWQQVVGTEQQISQERHEEQQSEPPLTLCSEWMIWDLFLSFQVELSIC